MSDYSLGGTRRSCVDGLGSSTLGWPQINGDFTEIWGESGCDNLGLRLGGAIRLQARDLSTLDFL
jgi:hypothetical protein